MRNPVSRHFNDRKKSREDREAYNGNMAVLTMAIKYKDRQTTSLVFSEIKDSPLLTTQEYDRLLNAAIHTDDTVIFSTLLSKQSSPNYWFDTRAQGLGNYQHILYTAIEAGSKDIALFLAKNKEVCIDQSGLSVQASCIGKKFQAAAAPYPTPLELAEQKGMNEVATVIAGRLSREYGARARQAKVNARAAQSHV